MQDGSNCAPRRTLGPVISRIEEVINLTAITSRVGNES